MKIKFTRNKPPAVGEWQIHLIVSRDFMRGQAGWRSASFGIWKPTEEPPEGVEWTNHYYKGFIWRWRYWLPFERGY